MFVNVAVEALKITFLVLLMMIAVDFINVRTKGSLEAILRKGRQWRQYVVASLLGAAPGCLGSFAGVSLYIHGMISFGALSGLMLATAGDEQFIMLAMFPQMALLLFGILFLLGIISGYATDLLVNKLGIETSSQCDFRQYHPGNEGYQHYFIDHIWKHIIKKHLTRVFLWSFGALFIMEIGVRTFDLKNLTSDYSFLLLILGAFIGMIPESGPHMVFVILYSKGLIPFSVLLTSSIVQDGHGMLPMLSYSFKDFFKIKIFNLGFGLAIGIITYLIGY